MANIIPKSEGFVSPEVFDNLKNELRDVVVPLLDGINLLEDGFTLTREGLEAVNAVKSLPELSAAQRTQVIGTALGQIVAEITEDLVVVYPEEV